MKKVRKLTLSKETLRYLTDPYLSRVAGMNAPASAGTACYDCTGPQGCGTSWMVTGCNTSAC